MYQQLIQEHFEQLSKGQKKVASYILESPHDVALKSAQEIGEAVGVSETTVIRFCYAIKLSGYSELQSIIRSSFMKSKSSLGTYLATKNKIEANGSFHEKVMQNDAMKIQEVSELINKEYFQESCQSLHSAKKIYVLGLRSSYAAAQWLGFTLNLLRPDIYMIEPQSQDIIQLLSHMKKGEVLIVLSFHRYYKETIDLTRMIKNKGVTIIGISDAMTAPLYRYADYYFPLGSAETSTIDIMPIVISFLNTLVSGMTIQAPEQYEMYKAQYDSVDSSFLFLDGDDFK
ncbi:MurR/RpiR family transcriptional regulator [Rummeliibacillus sp. POC4]|uniref:MurR/RpiR family transcriptional regulator n=1 Tax=Rummeliibacillus sp. POC4 TaxID=2305899 RepID=UPI000E66FC2B|nr:MurR/RpiR family transcriptional regulator [Rummeliibacillus sp. POC4]RIJ66937.1 MurR/RpiR family transcriptional regulator [Rummeliibacillus sp. POC4]